MSIRSSTRRFLSLRVGGTHTLEVLLYVRQKDRKIADQHEGELRDILSTRVVPREFQDEIEAYHEKIKGTFAAKTGEKNQQQPSKIGKATGKRKRKSKAKAKPVPVVPEEKPRRDVRHVFGENIQLTYRLQDVDKGNEATVSVVSDSEHLTFHQYPKLSKRLVAWCFPKSEADEEEPSDGGFPRPELIPIADLFR